MSSAWSTAGETRVTFAERLRRKATGSSPTYGSSAPANQSTSGQRASQLKDQDFPPPPKQGQTKTFASSVPKRAPSSPAFVPSTVLSSPPAPAPVSTLSESTVASAAPVSAPASPSAPISIPTPAPQTVATPVSPTSSPKSVQPAPQPTAQPAWRAKAPPGTGQGNLLASALASSPPAPKKPSAPPAVNVWTVRKQQAEARQAETAREAEEKARQQRAKEAEQQRTQGTPAQTRDKGSFDGKGAATNSGPNFAAQSSKNAAGKKGQQSDKKDPGFGQHKESRQERKNNRRRALSITSSVSSAAPRPDTGKAKGPSSSPVSQAQRSDATKGSSRPRNATRSRREDPSAGTGPVHQPIPLETNGNGTDEFAWLRNIQLLNGGINLVNFSSLEPSPSSQTSPPSTHDQPETRTTQPGPDLPPKPQSHTGSRAGTVNGTTGPPSESSDASPIPRNTLANHSPKPPPHFPTPPRSEHASPNPRRMGSWRPRGSPHTRGRGRARYNTNHGRDMEYSYYAPMLPSYYVDPTLVAPSSAPAGTPRSDDELPNAFGQLGFGAAQQPPMTYVPMWTGNGWGYGVVPYMTAPQSAPAMGLNGYPLSTLPSAPMPQGPHGEGDIVGQIVAQIAFYFSTRNLEGDFYLRSCMDAQGWVPLSTLAAFKRCQALESQYVSRNGSDPDKVKGLWSAVAERLAETDVEVDESGEKVRPPEGNKWAL